MVFIRKKTKYITLFFGASLISFILVMGLVLPFVTRKTLPNGVETFLDDTSDKNSGMVAANISDFVRISQGVDWNKYYNPTTGQYRLQTYSVAVNYQNLITGEWSPINTSFYYLNSSHPAYQYGYRVGNDHGIFNAYFKPNGRDDWTVCFSYNKSATPAIHVLQSQLVGCGYVDPSKDWKYEVLQTIQNSPGDVSDNICRYYNCFTGTNVSWKYYGSGLKEEITLDNTTKETLQAHPPSEFGLSNQSSYFAFATKLRYHGLHMQESVNFTVTDGRIELYDDTGEVLFFIPVEDVFELNNPFNRSTLTYRIIQYNEEYFLLTGIKASVLNDMEFPVVFDPILALDAGNLEADVCGDLNSGSPDNWDIQMKWNISGLAAGNTITDATLTMYIEDIWSPDTDANYSRVANFTWTETPSAAEYNAMPHTNYTESYSWSTVADDSYATLNVTPAVSYGYQLGDSNVTLRLRDIDDKDATASYVLNDATYLWYGAGEFILQDNYNIRFYGRAGTHPPFLNITYTGPPNILPTIIMNHPTNNSIHVEGTPTANVTINDANGETMEIKWETNSSGSWTVNNTDSGLSNGSYSYVYSGFNDENTSYWWRINVSDGTGYNVSEEYHLITTYAPTFGITGVMFPTNNTWNNVNPVELKTPVLQQGGYDVNVTIYDYTNAELIHSEDINNGTGSWFWDLGDNVESKRWNTTLQCKNFTTKSEIYTFIINNTWTDSYTTSYLVNNTHANSTDGDKSYHGLQVLVDKDGFANYTQCVYTSAYASSYDENMRTIDSTMHSDSHNLKKISPHMVFNKSGDGTGWVFDHDQSEGMSFWWTEDFGRSWVGPTSLDNFQAPTGTVAVWYDNWTYADPGTKIHIVAANTTQYTYDYEYTWLDTATNTTRGYWTVIGFNGLFTAGDGPPTICKTPNGRLWAGVGGLGINLTYSDDDGVTWTEKKPGSLFDDDDDQFQVLPLGENDIILLYQDMTAQNLQYAIYWYANDSWSGFTQISTNDGADTAFSATYCMLTGDILIAHLDDTIAATGDIESFVFWDHNRTLSGQTVVEANAYGYGAPVVMSAQGTDDAYIIFVDGTTQFNTAMYASNSTDGGMTWTTPYQISPADGYRNLGSNFMDYNTLYVTGVDDSVDDLDGKIVANYTKGSLITQWVNMTSTVIYKTTSHQLRWFNITGSGNVDFNITNGAWEYNYTYNSLLGNLTLGNNNISIISWRNNTLQLRATFKGNASLQLWNVTAEAIAASQGDETLDLNHIDYEDAAMEFGDGTFYSDNYISTVDNVGTHTSPSSALYRCIGGRFQNVTIPKGATINTAYIELYSITGKGTMDAHLYGHDDDNSVDFNDLADIIDDRVRTTANVDYYLPSIGTGWKFASTEIKSIIQEIIDRPGWESKNLTLLMIADTDVNNKRANFKTWYYTTPTMGWHLYIQYYYPDNYYPVLSAEEPTNESTSISPNPTLNITIADQDADTMNLTWYSNHSGPWLFIGENLSKLNGTYSQPDYNSNFSTGSTTYWWNVTVDDGNGNTVTETYHFTTEIAKAWHQDSTWNMSFSNTSGWIQDYTWNVSFSNTSMWRQDSSWNMSFSNTPSMIQDYTWNVSFSNTSSWSQDSSWNVSFSNTSIWRQDSTWNMSFSNSSVAAWLQDYTWNVSFSNTSSWSQDSSWNVSFSNTSSWTQDYTWNVSFSNNTVDWRQDYTWNISFSNTSSLTQDFTWNMSFSNTTLWHQDFTWNLSFSNSSFAAWVQHSTWNMSFSNTTLWTQDSSWNMSFSNTSSWIQDSSWNVSFSNNTVDWRQHGSWNISFSNTSSLTQDFTWNMSFSNTTLWHQDYTWNVSFSNSSFAAWVQHSTWNVSFSNTTIWTQGSTWNMSFSNTSGWIQDSTWNISFSNSSVAAWTQDSTWNISFSNTTLWTQDYTWNISFSNSTPPLIWNQDSTWNISFSNSSICAECDNTLLESNSIGTDNYNIDAPTDTGGQTFTLDNTALVSCLRLQIRKYSSPSNITINITTTTGSPTEPDTLLSQGTINIDDVGTDYCWIPVNITPIVLTRNTEYALVVNLSDADGTNKIDIQMNLGGNPYTDGHKFYSTNGGDTWTHTAEYDLLFEIYGTTPITFTNEYPTNESTLIPLQPITYLTISQSDGETMNLTFYYGNSSVNTTNQMGTIQTNISNGTYYQTYFNATQYYTEYWWRVYANDGTNYVNESYYFTTDDDIEMITGRDYTFALAGLMGLALAGLVFVMMYTKKRKKRRY